MMTWATRINVNGTQVKKNMTVMTKLM
jgi:hypothetical protein